MLGNLQLLMQLGVIMLFAFIAASLASRFKQSVILGYIIVGALIGPYVSLNLFGIQYNGLVQDISFVEYLSQLGLVLLLFFLGLEFSFTKLRKIKGPATLLALLNTGVDLFMGVVLGMALGWPLVDTIFLAGVVAMGSAAITGKSLMELNRFSNPETEVLLGMMVMEDFVSMIVLAIMGGLIMQAGSIGLGAESIPNLLLGIGVFFAFFAFLAAVVIPRTASYLSQIKSDELFVLFALGMVFLSAALAEASGVPAIIGAFFLGMVFSETKLAERFGMRLTSFRDVFVAIFFVFFGMLIDPAMFPGIITVVLIAVPVALLGEMIILPAIAYLMGFSSRAAVSMGASMCGRGAESIMYASMGSGAAGVTKGAEINPFAGLFCFTMSLITPALIRFSDQIARFFSKLLPSYVKQGGAIMSRTMGKILLPSSLKLFKRSRRIEVSLIAYFLSLLVVAGTTGIWHWLTFFAALSLTVWISYMLKVELAPVVRSINYENLGASGKGSQQISHFIASFISISLLAILVVAFLFQLAWWLSLVVMASYAIALLLLMNHYAKIIRNPFTASAIRSPRPWSLETTTLVSLPHKSPERMKGEPSAIAPSQSVEREAHEPKRKWKYL
ncbi:MAG: cation:proton antiporter [Methanomassiliicoccales archaeon]